MRKAYSNRQKEKLFSNSFHVNEKFLPTYNALEDPYLEGFFDRPQLKKHLKSMSLMRKKKSNHSNFEDVYAFTRINSFN